jgi:hypothetical protein
MGHGGSWVGWAGGTVRCPGQFESTLCGDGDSESVAGKLPACPASALRVSLRLTQWQAEPQARLEAPSQGSDSESETETSSRVRVRGT